MNRQPDNVLEQVKEVHRELGESFTTVNQWENSRGSPSTSAHWWFEQVCRIKKIEITLQNE
jgi:hypothetical protein